MARQKQSLVWEVVSEEEWEQRNALNAARKDTRKDKARAYGWRRFSSSRLWTIVLVALFLTSSGLYIVWRQAQIGLAHIDSELNSAVEADAWIANPQTGAKSKVTKVEMRDLSDGLAVVDVTSENSAGNAYRYTQFYRHDNDKGWQRTSPDASYWGPEQSAETSYFRWYFRARDRVVVTQVAEQMDSFYLELRHDLGLPSPSTTEKLIIDVQAGAQDSSSAALELDSTHHLNIPSPLLLISPAQLSEVDALRLRLFPLLIQQTLRSAQAQQPIWCIWRPLLDGLVQWQLHAYQPAPVDGEVTLAPTLPTLQDLLDKDETCLDRPVNRIAATPEDPVTAALGETLFAYVVATHGREGVTTLMDVFRHYSTWQEAIPAAFATRADAFERDWQRYVAAQHKE